MEFIDIYEGNSKLAKRFAQKKHEGQIRKFDGSPYFVHPDSVANTVSKYTKDEDVIAAAYLHDTLEDTPTTMKELEMMFNKRVAKLVLELTSKKVPGKEKGKYLTAKMNKMSPDALLIKLADRFDNVSDFKTAPPKFVERYSIETQYILDNLNRALKPAHKKLIYLIKKKIKSPKID